MDVDQQRSRGRGKAVTTVGVKPMMRGHLVFIKTRDKAVSKYCMATEHSSHVVLIRSSSSHRMVADAFVAFTAHEHAQEVNDCRLEALILSLVLGCIWYSVYTSI